MRRFAIFSDIHGNIAALDPVLADIAAAGIEELYCLGDLVGYGPEPAAVVERIRSAGIPTIRGNYDEGIGNRRGECGCYYATDQARSDGAASYAFTDAAIDDEDAAWLAALPGEIRFEAEGIRALLAHGSPRKINEYLRPDRTDKLLARLADEAGADLVCVGHVHVPYHRTLLSADRHRMHYVSSGSVGKPKDGDPRAAWVEVVLGGAEEVATVVHRVAYDVDAVAAAVIAAGLPLTLADALRRA
jgi:predicted phosphodiesterase